MKTSTLKLFLTVLLTATAAFAQEFRSHQVKEGETLYSIARIYRVTPYNILKFNKEIDKDAPLRPNTILVIPMDAKAAGTTLTPSTAVKEEQPLQDSIPQRQPASFTSHRVRKKETLFGIAKQYGISEEDLKRYNKDLYASRLDKGMRLRIPVFPARATQTDSILSGDFEAYTVKARETRWSIAHSYGITIDSLLSLNPGLPRANSYLAEGQELRLPKKAGSSVEGQEVQIYLSYTVPPKETFYNLEKKFGIGHAELIKLNPEIVERGGLKEGMVLRFPKKKPATEAVSTEKYVFYEVKPKQTTYSLTRTLGIGYGDLLALNPDLSSGLKAGMVLKLPKEDASGLEVRNSLVLDKINLLDSIDREIRPRVMFMLPFRLDKLNLAEEENTRKAIVRSNALTYSLGLYSGALVALDSLADLGISVDVNTFDTQLSLERTKQILSRHNLNEFDAVFGPLDPASLQEVAVRAAGQGVPVIAPVPFNSEVSLNNVFFTYTSEEVLRERMLEHLEERVKDQNLIIIADLKNDAVKELILSKFPQAMTIIVKEEEENISIDIEALYALLSEEQENWVFVETENFKLVSSVSSILNSATTENIKVRMFTTNKNRAFDNDVISGTHLSNLNFTYPSVFREVGENDAFVKRYRKRFGSNPDRYAVRGFDIVYDMLLKLVYKEDLFEASMGIGTTEYSGNKFNYSKDLLSGYYNTGSYIMMYENMYIKQVVN